MKLRVRADSIRLRLGRDEVRRLADEGFVEERTHIAPDAPPFVWALRTADDARATTASFDGSGLVVTVPRPVARQWADSELVGLEASQPAGNGRTLHILVEKDFECLDGPPGENQDDAFPNPKARC